MILLLALASFSVLAPGQTPPDSVTGKLSFQPRPREMTYRGSVCLSLSPSDTIRIVAATRGERQAANFLNRILQSALPERIEVKIGDDHETSTGTVRVLLRLARGTGYDENDQSYSLRWIENGTQVTITSTGVLGLLYGVVTLYDCVQTTDTGVTIAQYDIDDHPAYRRRIIPAVLTSENVEEVLQFALMHKIETVAIASRVFPWDHIDSAYAVILDKIENWKEQFGGPHIMQMHNIYSGRRIEISNPADIDALNGVIETSLRHGVDKLMILADDLVPFVFGKGYVLTTDRDKNQFTDIAEAHVALMREISALAGRIGLPCEMYYVPPYYTYEDMNCGDMGLFKDTPWQEDAFRPLYRQLEYVGKTMPKDVFVVWSGPHVHSRTITVEDLEDWTRNLGGRVPFLWDNTIYSHYAFTTTPLFTAYENTFPRDFSQRTAGEGMYLNGDLAAEDMKVAAITANDFWWNPASYDPAASLRTAMTNRYGGKCAPLLLEFKQTELALRRMIGERRLWAEADTLWKVIRAIRGITDKNPFAYHLNYTRLKALQMQLKSSVHAPLPLPRFLEACHALDAKRRYLLNAVGQMKPDVSARLLGLMVPLPDPHQVPQ
jgi:hypothetical protein